MGTLLIWAGVIVLVALGLSYAWPKLRSLLPASWQTVGDKVEVAVDKTTASAALNMLVSLFNERGDTDRVKLLGELWVAIWAWQPPAATVTPTVEQLASEVSALKAKAAGG